MSRERELIRRAAAGDRDAFDRLVEGRWARIHRIARRITGDGEEAKDVAQQTCLRLWRELRRFQEERELDAWIYRMTVNLSIDALRRRRARPDREGVPVEDLAERRMPRAGSGPDVRLFALELERALQAVTRDLPPRQKAVFVLARTEGMSAGEIGRLLGIAPSTVRNHLFQVRARIAERLRREFPGLIGEDEGRAD
ncbi:MAG: RNA polymerase sigma factor [Acidobacteria bacterium]|nr:MAG: RNA polymerase sigma factor [Acidobacteriota bacterium]